MCIECIIPLYPLICLWIIMIYSSFECIIPLYPLICLWIIMIYSSCASFFPGSFLDLFLFFVWDFCFMPSVKNCFLVCNRQWSYWKKTVPFIHPSPDQWHRKLLYRIANKKYGPDRSDHRLSGCAICDRNENMARKRI